MAAPETIEIEMKWSLRPVYVRTQTDNKVTLEAGLFHTWITDSYPARDEQFGLAQMSKTYGLVEFSDGVVKRIRVRDIQFADTRHVMGSIAWTKDDQEDQEDQEETEEQP